MPTGFAAFLELCCGPLYILAKVQLADGVVAVAEAAAIVAKGTLTLYLLKRGSLPVAIALSWAQVNTLWQHAHLVKVKQNGNVYIHFMSNCLMLSLEQPHYCLFCSLLVKL